MKMCKSHSWEDVARKVAGGYVDYSIYCLGCMNSRCRSLGLPQTCPVCNGRIRIDKTTC